MNYVESIINEIENIIKENKNLLDELNYKKSKDFDYAWFISGIVGFIVSGYSIILMCNNEILLGTITLLGSFPLSFSGLFLTFYLEKKNDEKIKILNDKIEENKKILLNKVIKLEKIRNKEINNTNYNNGKIINNNYSNSISNKKYKLKVKKREK